MSQNGTQVTIGGRDFTVGRLTLGLLKRSQGDLLVIVQMFEKRKGGADDGAAISTMIAQMPTAEELSAFTHLVYAALLPPDKPTPGEFEAFVDDLDMLTGFNDLAEAVAAILAASGMSGGPAAPGEADSPPAA